MCWSFLLIPVVPWTGCCLHPPCHRQTKSPFHKQWESFLLFVGWYSALSSYHPCLNVFFKPKQGTNEKACLIKVGCLQSCCRKPVCEIRVDSTEAEPRRAADVVFQLVPLTVSHSQPPSFFSLHTLLPLYFPSIHTSLCVNTHLWQTLGPAAPGL